MRPKVHPTASRVMTTHGAGEPDGEPRAPQIFGPAVAWRPQNTKPGTRNSAHETAAPARPRLKHGFQPRWLAAAPRSTFH